MSDDRRHGRNGYDVVVIGSGIAGITAASLLARSGRSVLVVEQGDGVGGYVHAFRRSGYTIDPAVHAILDPALYDALLGHLDVRERCTLIPLESYYQVQFPGLRFSVPFGADEVIEAHAACLPERRDEIRAFFEVCRRIHREGHEVSTLVSLRDLDEQAARFPTLFRYRKATLGAALDEMFTDERARAVAASSSVLLGLPPSRLSFTTFAQAVFAAAVSGACYVEGGVPVLVDAFAASVVRDGGAVVTGTAATRIIVESGRATGVELSDGRVFGARVVLSNADVLHTFDDLVGDATPPDVRRRLTRLTPSVSAFVVYAGTDMDVSTGGFEQMIFRCASFDLDADYDANGRGDPRAVVIYIPTLVDRSSAPSGHHLLTGAMPVPYDSGAPWRELKPRYLARFVALFEEMVPGIGERLDLVEAATPETLVRFTRNHVGAIYGWESSPENTASRRPPQRTSIRGLYLAGHWTQPGSGFVRAVTSGVHAAELIAADGLAGGGDVFHPPQLPAAPLGTPRAGAANADRA